METDLIIQMVVSGIVIGGFYSLMSIGLSLIFGVTKMVNFAHGEFMMLGMYLTYWIWHSTGADPYLLLLISMPTLFLFGALIYKALVDRVIGGIDEQQIFLTVGLSIFLQNIALLSWTGTYRTVTTAYSMAILSAGPVTISVPRFLAFICSVILAVAITLFLKFAKTGKAMRATAEDIEAAMLMGIKPRRMFLLSFAIGSALVGGAGTFLVSFYYTWPTIGAIFTLLCFVTVVLGGLGSIVGCLIAGPIIGVVEGLGSLALGAEMKLVVVYAVFVLTLLFKPKGLMGRRML